MCGRFAVYYTIKDLKNVFNISDNININPNYNTTPLTRIPVIIQGIEKCQYHIESMQWGLIPYWSKDEAVANKLINARAETLTEKPSFKKSFQRNRCIIPVSGFYEWHSKTRKPYYIKPKSGLLFFAGLWDEWKNPSGYIVKTCAIITTEPNDLLKDIHNRMPVILKPGDYQSWLDPNTSTDNLKRLLKPYSNEMLECIEISKRVNSPSNNDVSIIQSLK